MKLKIWLLSFVLLYITACMGQFGFTIEIDGPAAVLANRQAVFTLPSDTKVEWKAYGVGVDTYVNPKDTSTIVITPYSGESFILVGATTVDSEIVLSDLIVKVMNQNGPLPPPDPDKDDKDDEVKPIDKFEQLAQDVSRLESDITKTQQYTRELQAIKRSYDNSISYLSTEKQAGRTVASERIRTTQRNFSATGLNSAGIRSGRNWTIWNNKVAELIEAIAPETMDDYIRVFTSIKQGMETYGQ